MIKLTQVQQDVLLALACLDGGTSGGIWTSVDSIYHQRVGKVKRVNVGLVRSTKGALEQMRSIVPQLVEEQKEKWHLTVAGRTVANVQLRNLKPVTAPVGGANVTKFSSQSLGRRL